MHDYAGDPNKFPISVPLVDDADLNPPTAANLDLGPQALADRTAFLLARAGGPALDYGRVQSAASLLPASNTVFTCAAWDSITRQWLVGGMDLPTGAGSATAYRLPNGYTDGSFGAIAPAVNSGGALTVVPFDVLFDGTNFVMVGINTAGHVFVSICSPGGAWSVPFSDTSTTFVHATLHRLGTQILLAYSSSTTTHFFYSADHGATWTDTTFALASYTAGIGELLADNGTLAILVASANKSTYLSGSNGAGLWTARSVPWGTDVPMGAAYARDASGPAFFVVTEPGGGGMNVWKSADGINWASVGSFQPAINPTSLAAIGSLLAATSSPSGGLTGGVYVSLDFGVTWRPAVNSPVVDSSAFAGLRPGVVASDSQFMCFWQASARWSRVVYPPAAA